MWVKEETFTAFGAVFLSSERHFCSCFGLKTSYFKYVNTIIEVATQVMGDKRNTNQFTVFSYTDLLC